MENTIENKSDVVQDILQNGYKIIQGKKDFKFGIDAFLLAWFAHDGIRNGQSVIDLCTGTGIVPLLLSSSSRAAHISGLEIQQKSAEMAKRSVELNGLSQKIEIIQGDVKNVSEIFKAHSVEAVTCNPPYMIYGHGKQNPAGEKAISRFEVLCALEDVVSAADYLLKPSGVFYMVHRPFRLAEIFAALNRHKIEPKRMVLVCPHSGEEPNIVLVEARKNANPRITVEKPLVVYTGTGDYTEEIKKIYSTFDSCGDSL